MEPTGVSERSLSPGLASIYGHAADARPVSTRSANEICIMVGGWEGGQDIEGMRMSALAGVSRCPLGQQRRDILYFAENFKFPRPLVQS
jgi:hypothetical protein